KSNYDLMLTLAKEDDEERIYKDLAARSAVDGVILHGPKINDNRINMLNELRIPFVVHGRSSGSKENYNWVDVNNESAFFRATEFLIDLGHKSIALINGDPNMDFAMRRNTGYGRALEAAKISIDDTKKFNGEMTEPFGYKCTIDMLESNKPPSAIIASSIIVAIGIRRALDDKGLKIGNDISVLTFDDDLSYFRDEGTVPLFTSTKSSVREAGYKSANLLLEAIMNPTDEKKGILLEAELTIGRSTKSFKPIF
ncbi:substrate-binding domain-containing protein, partial [Amylibacter sp.]|nr:substrate-binding domain-containing protein [Amylibacter sp.]